MKNMTIDVTAGQLTICYSTSILSPIGNNRNLFDRSYSISEDFIKELSFVNLLYAIKRTEKKKRDLKKSNVHVSIE